MELPVFDNTAGFHKFIQSEFPDLANEIVTPKKPDDLPLTVRLAYENYNGGKEYQNHFGNSGLGSTPLPVAVEMRRRAGTLEAGDAPALRAANLEHLAQQCETLGAEQDDARLAVEAEQGRKRFLEEKKAFEALQGQLPNLPQEQVIFARQQWGVSGLAEWQK